MTSPAPLPGSGATGADPVAEFLRRYPETSAVDVLLPDGSGILRGKRLPIDQLAKLDREGCPFPGSMFALDITGATIEATGLSWTDGEADRPCRPIAGTLQPVPWAARPTAQVLLAMQDADGRPFALAPRTALQRAADRLAALGLTAVAAIELEFYLLDRDWHNRTTPQPPRQPARGARPVTTQVYGMTEFYDFEAVLADIVDAARAQGIPAETAIAEYGPGQCEINLRHVADPLRAADDAVLFKRLVRGVAARHGFDATFMAKPYADHPGNGLHVHVSMLDRHGANIFAPTDPAEPLSSPALRHAAGGLMATMPGAMALFAPNANSYRRFQPAAYVPLAPCWGYNNRTVALRVPAGPPAASRIEHRVAGADANPYLVLAAVLTGMLYGLDRRVDPGPPVRGSAYHAAPPAPATPAAAPLPLTWAAALDALDQDSVLRQGLGPAFVDVHLAIRRAERLRFEAQVTPLEYDWYLRTS